MDRIARANEGRGWLVEAAGEAFGNGFIQIAGVFAVVETDAPDFRWISVERTDLGAGWVYERGSTELGGLCRCPVVELVQSVGLN